MHSLMCFLWAVTEGDTLGNGEHWGQMIQLGGKG